MFDLTWIIVQIPYVSCIAFQDQHFLKDRWIHPFAISLNIPLQICNRKIFSQIHDIYACY